MNPGADRANRSVLLLLGLLLTAAAAVGLVVSYGAFGVDRARRPVFTTSGQDFVNRNHGWFWPAVAIAAVLLGLLALRWLLAQLGSDRAGTLPLEPDTRQGSTRLAASALTGALTEEIESYQGVRQASARLLHDPRQPDLVLTVSLNERADLSALRNRIEDHAIRHARQALSRDLPVELEIRLTAGERQLR